MQKWEYWTTDCVMGRGKNWGLGRKERDWFIHLGPEKDWVSLHEGLNYLGEAGYELVAVQLASIYTGAETHTNPSSR